MPGSTSDPSTVMRRTGLLPASGSMLSAKMPDTGKRTGSPNPARARAALTPASSAPVRARPYAYSRSETMTCALGKVGTQLLLAHLVFQPTWSEWMCVRRTRSTSPGSALASCNRARNPVENLSSTFCCGRALSLPAPASMRKAHEGVIFTVICSGREPFRMNAASIGIQLRKQLRERHAVQVCFPNLLNGRVADMVDQARFSPGVWR